MSSSWGKKSQSPEKRNENSSSASKRTSLNLQDTPENSRQFRSGSALRQRNTSADVNDTYITLDKARYADLARRVDSNSESSPNPEANSNRLAGASNSESHSGSPLLRTHPILYPAQDQETSETSDHRVSQADGKNISEARLVKQDLVKHDHRTQADSKNFSEVRLVKPDDSKRSASFLLGKALASKAKKPDQAIFVPKRQLEERAAREKAAAEKEEKVRLAAEQKNREYIEAQVAKRAAESDHSRNLSKMNGWGRVSHLDHIHWDCWELIFADCIWICCKAMKALCCVWLYNAKRKWTTGFFLQRWHLPKSFGTNFFSTMATSAVCWLLVDYLVVSIRTVKPQNEWN